MINHYSRQSHIFNADCLAVLKLLGADTVDALVTDPPAGISFMGKDWDSFGGGMRNARSEFIVGMRQSFEECLRVMKPGAHGLVWAIPRTSHWAATALEDAGFEIRDVVVHLFGTGFPKSLDISKAIDKAAGVDFKKEPASGVGFMNNSKEDGYNPTLNQLKRVGESTDAAKQWDGWGTALKPAAEHWILVRKPLGEKTVAANVLKWGVGGINVDASRVEGAFESGWAKSGSKASQNLSMSGANTEREPKPDSAIGRFPANLILDEGAATLLDEQSGISASGSRAAGVRKGLGFGGGQGDGGPPIQANSGGASRFFYVAKASKADKTANGTVENKHPTVKNTELMKYLIKLVTPPSSIVLDPFMGSGSTGVASAYLEMGLKFVGIEQDPESYKTALARLNAASPDVAFSEAP